MPRVRGYHYVRDSRGRKRRVYGTRTRRSYGKRGGFGRVYGRGAYRVKRRAQSGRQLANIPRSGKRRSSGFVTLGFGANDPPKMSMSAGGVTVSHREYIQDITSSIPFIGENFALNPGVAGTFPWLSQIAENFEEWVPIQILFEYKTTSSNTVVNASNSNPGLGTVIAATQYNPLNNNFGNKQQMENYENAVSVDPSRSMLHPIECASKQTPLHPLFVRVGTIPANQDIRWYDLGKTTIATVGQQTNNFVIGELWITYTIKFLKPKLQTGIASATGAVADLFHLRGNSANIGGFQGVSPDNPFGTQPTLQPPTNGSTLGGVLSGGISAIASHQNVAFPPSLGGPKPFFIFGMANGIVVPIEQNSVQHAYYFPPGVTSGFFLCSYTALYTNQGTPATQTNNPNFNANGCVVKNIFNGNLSPGESNTTSASTTTDMHVFAVEVQANYAFFTVSGTAGMTNCIQADFTIIQLPTGI